MTKNEEIKGKMRKKDQKSKYTDVHVDRGVNISNAVESKQLQGFARIWKFKKGINRELDTF